MNATEFYLLQDEIGKAIENKTVEFGNSRKHRDYAERFAKGDFRPSFAIIDREGRIKVLWCQNRPRDIVELERLSFVQADEGLNDEEWTYICLRVKNRRQSLKVGC